MAGSLLQNLTPHQPPLPLTTFLPPAHSHHQAAFPLSTDALSVRLWLRCPMNPRHQVTNNPPIAPTVPPPKGLLPSWPVLPPGRGPCLHLISDPPPSACDPLRAHYAPRLGRPSQTRSASQGIVAPLVSMHERAPPPHSGRRSPPCSFLVESRFLDSTGGGAV